MTLALFEILTGRYADGSPARPDAPEATARSVEDHLHRLLNARAGMLAHLPGHGLPDLPALYAELPYSAEGLAAAVRQLIQRFEPRLADVQVQPLTRSGPAAVVGLAVTGCLPDGRPLRMESRFAPDGAVAITTASRSLAEAV